MPPKKKGHTLMGKQKVFRHAVEHVRLGLGHTVLGNLNLGLAASTPSTTEGSSAIQRPAFYVELNEQLLSHSSKDFKKFRWEVLELCETVPLFQLHHRQLAQRLLARLMDRGTHRVGEEESDANGSKNKRAKKDDGATTQAYEAFARLTIAFVRDMGSKFLPYYQIFQQAVQAGMYDQSGQLIVDTARLQLVFAVQAAWCRELRHYWADPSQLVLACRVVRQYVQQLHDTKEYVRRLSAELLAFLCRLCRPLLPIVVEEACGDVLRSYEKTATAALVSEAHHENSSDEENEADENVDEDDDRDENGLESGATAAATFLAPSIWGDRAQLLDFTRNTLSHHPVVDGLTFFVAELFRGVRGALSSSFETHYVRLLHVFQLMDLNTGTATKSKGGGDQAPATTTDDGAARVPRSCVNVVRCLHQQRHQLATFLDASSNDDDHDEEHGADNTSKQSSCSRRSADIHTTRWAAVFELGEDVSADKATAEEEEEDDAEGATVRSSDDVFGARYLLRQVGSLTLGSATATVLRETKKLSALAAQTGESSEDDDDEAEDDEERHTDTAAGGDDGDVVAHGSIRPSHRVLTAVMLCFNPSAATVSTPQYVQLLTAVMNAVDFALWSDDRESALLKQLATDLLALLKPSKVSSKVEVNAAVPNTSAVSSLENASAVLRLLSPLCLSPYLGSASSVVANGRTPHLLQLQQWFVPVAKAAVQTCAKSTVVATAAESKATAQEEAEQILFAFAQDVLQKNYAFAIEQERRIAEEADMRDISAPTNVRTSSCPTAAAESREDACVSEDDEDAFVDGEGAAAASRKAQSPFSPRAHARIPPFLTPFALTLLHTISMQVWQRATTHVSTLTGAATAPSSSSAVSSDAAITVALRQASIQRAVLLSRLLQDHTQHMSASPLQQLLRLKPAAAAVPSKASKDNHKEASVRDVLKDFVLSLLKYYRASETARNAVNSDAMSYVSCALPAIQVLVYTSSGADALPTASSVKAALLEVLRDIEGREGGQRKENEKPYHVRDASLLRVYGTLDPAAYALYAEVAAMLVQLTATPSLRGGKKQKLKTKKQAIGTDDPAAVAAHATTADAEREGLHHLCRTVAVLVQGFQQLQRVSKSVAAQMNRAEAGADTEESLLTVADASAVSDDVRVQLLHGAEVLLHALLWMLGLDSDAQQQDGADASTGASKASRLTSSSSHDPALSVHTRQALHTLHAALPDDLHAVFVQDVLFECLTAPIAGLRLHALRLIRFLCHPSLEQADRLTGVPAVPLDILDALLNAARFNPLSHTGNLDGMQQELSRLTFKVESGAITQPFERVLIARTMVGFLYVKFAGAWVVASKILCFLVTQERTVMVDGQEQATTKDQDEEVEEQEEDGGQDAEERHHHESQTKSPRSTRLAPVVWNSVICVNARSLILGDVVVAESAATGSETAASRHSNEEDRHRQQQGGANVDAEAAAEAIAVCHRQLAQLPCLYEIQFTDQQRHAKGELVSRAFSSTQYSTSSFTLLDSTTNDFEMVRWGQHWIAAPSQAAESKGGRKSGKSATSSGAAAALYATSTDRATLAQTFLAMLETMVKSSSAVDRKVRLVEDVVIELVAVERNRHPSGIDASKVRRLDQRLEMAMRACAAAPTGVLSAHQRKRLSEAAQRDVDARNAELQAIFLSYLSDVNPRLQRTAVDNLKRLKVEPFSIYHAKLTPYADTMKALFAFLSTFHVESDVSPHDRVSYISAALSLALPKLLTKVSKDKLRDQAVLSRRLMGYLEHLPPPPISARGCTATKDPMAEVFDELLHRLLSFAMPSATASSSAAPPAANAAPAQGGVNAYNFLTNVWDEVVYGGCGLTSPSAVKAVEAHSRRSGPHGIRRLERLMKQLNSALRLLEAMLHAVGQRFAVYVSTCLHVALQSYLVACKQCLRRPVDLLVGELDNGERGSAFSPEQQERVRHWTTFLNRSLASSTLSTALSHVRRSAVTIVALLSEQFPEEVVDTLRNGSTTNNNAVVVAGSSGTSSSLMLFTNYLQALFDNSKGTTLDGSGAGGGALPSPIAAKSYVTPVLRLLMAWVRSPVLLPLFPAYADIAVGTLEEVFAVNANASSVHRASTQAVYEGLRCVSELLACADEPVDVPLRVFDTTSDVPVSAKKKKPQASVTTSTFRQCFLEQHIVGVFASLYNLLTSGAAREDAEETTPPAPAENSEKAHASDKATPKRNRTNTKPSRDAKRRPTSIMSLSISMWREVMRTVSQLSHFLKVGAAAAVLTGPGASLNGMMSRLLELALKMIAHPVCMTDASTAQMVTGVAHTLMAQVGHITYREHWQPLVRLFNVVPNPQARHSLCAILAAAVEKLPLSEPSTSIEQPLNEEERRRCFQEQMAATARAVSCLNSFEDEETFARYDFELRYHTLHSLHDFFAHFGNYGALPRGGAAVVAHAASGGSAVRKERAFVEVEDVQLPLHKDYAPTLAPEAVAVLAANVMFLLRDPEQTIRALVLPLLQSMVRYASLGGQPPAGMTKGRGNAKRRAAAQQQQQQQQQQTSEGAATESEAAPQTSGISEAQQMYRTQLLETILRHEVLGSLRRGVVAKDVHIRCAHMQAFEGFARYFRTEFPSFALLYSPNTEQNFYANVGHVQHRCRLHALALLRQHTAEMNVRDVLRVHVPFLMSAVKDFAEGKRNQANLTEGRARGYCDAVLLTISSIAARLPWTAYYRVLSLFLSNASANVNLRATMLRGVVQVLNTFHFLDNGAAAVVDGDEQTAAAPMENGEDDDEVNDADDAVRAALSLKQREFRHAKVMRVLEADVLPQLYSYIGDKESKSMAGRGVTNQHSVTAVRREQQREDAATTQMKNALLQLPVAMAITKIVKHFPEERFNVHVNHLLDELIKKLRTKNDKHRESARRILGAMLQETGPSKLKFVVTKLKDNLVHGYQLHVLGYTVVTLLYQLYEPNSPLANASHAKDVARGGRTSAGTGDRGNANLHDPVKEVLEEAKQNPARRTRREAAEPQLQEAKEDDDDAQPGNATAAAAVDEDTAVEKAEEALLRELGIATHAHFDYQYGTDCLTRVLEDLLLIFLDDYLGEVGIQKEQVEVMSTMVEVKRNRALQGFSFLGKHCDAATVMEAFLHRITWVLTPPAETTVNASELHGSARARALLVQEMKSKYLTVGKGGSVDLIFVNKVRLLAVRVARSLMTNPTMSVEKSFEQVRRLLEQHNRTREEKAEAFEAKDGTRRIRGNAHLILHKADRHTRKEQLDHNFLVAPAPERVDVDFSAHTVLATQQKQKLRVYRGRYGKEVKEAAKNFYREDPVTAVVLDTLDEFLLKFLLSVLKQVLGIGKEKHYSKAAMKLDMLRHHRENQQKTLEGGQGADEEEEGDEATNNGVDGESGGDESTAPVENEDGDEDGLGEFAEAQAIAEDNATASSRRDGRKVSENKKSGSHSSSAPSTAAALLTPGSDLTVTFTREHRDLLESLVPVVLSCLQGEGSDVVVANALDCLLALVSLRPPLNAINDLQKELFETVTSFIERGSVIKQRAIRLTAAMVAHQKYVVSEANAVQLVKLVRAEVMERNEFMAVSLSLLYAVLGKHVHVPEIYDLMDIITELLLHWSARRNIRRRCILILVRFLLEFRLTPAKFKSHIDLYCRNLDYPELTGRTALLELLDALIVRLPAVILREEAPVLLVPLAATVTGSEWMECRRQGGTVVQHLARYAGVDVLVPVLSAWMSASQPRATRSMAVQVWATVVPALSEFYELTGDHVKNGEDEDEDAREQSRAAFQACCAWSVEAVLEGCLYDQVVAARRNKKLEQMSAKSKEKVELDGWAFIFYSLRAAEAMLAALPQELFPLFAPRLMPHITEVLLVHTHPWVRAAAMRILRQYLYAHVEHHCHYLQEDAWQQLASNVEGAGEGVATSAPTAGEVAPLLYVFNPVEVSAKFVVAQAMQTLQSLSTLFKRLLGLISTSDVAMETYNAHRAIADPARGELLKVAVYVLRALSQVSLFALTHSAAAAAALLETSPAQAQRKIRAYQDVQHRVRTVYTSTQHQLHSQITPAVQQGSLVNYMVRSVTLMQLVGGWMSVLPHEMVGTSDEGVHEEQQDAAPRALFNAQVRWVTQQLLCPTSLLQECVLPLLSLGLRAKPLSEKISLIAYQVTSVVEQQFEERRHELMTAVSTNILAPEAAATPVGKKRGRRSEAEEVSGSNAAHCESHGIPLDAVLVSLKTQLANIHDARRDQQVMQNAKKALKRSRRQMEIEDRKKQQLQMRRRPTSASGSTRCDGVTKEVKSSVIKTHRRGS